MRAPAFVSTFAAAAAPPPSAGQRSRLRAKAMARTDRASRSEMARANAVTAPASPPPAICRDGESARGRRRHASRSVLLRWLPLVIAAVYFAVMMPIGAHMILHYPDERHYAYGGARMVETGDWLIPRTPGRRGPAEEAGHSLLVQRRRLRGARHRRPRLPPVLGPRRLRHPPPHLRHRARASAPASRRRDPRGADDRGQPGVHARRDQFDPRHPSHAVRHRRRARLRPDPRGARRTGQRAAGPGSAGSAWRSRC